MWEALRTVRDPELDNDVVSLDFVASLEVDEHRVAHVRLRLPTYFCAPNFAFLMVADAWDAVSTVEGLDDVDVTLIDHFASDAINSGVAARAGFVNSMAGTEVGEAVDELDSLRRQFTERALMAGTDLVVRPMVTAGRTPEELAAMTLGDAPESEDLTPAAGPAARARDRGRGRRPLVVDPTRAHGRRRGAAAAPAQGALVPGRGGRQHQHLPRPARGALRVVVLAAPTASVRGARPCRATRSVSIAATIPTQAPAAA